MTAAASNVVAGQYGPIEVFRAGTFQDMSGSTQRIDARSLHEIAEGYDRENAPAPVVIGHPTTDAPAFGWVDRLYVEAGILKATLEKTVAEFAEAVKAGRYRRVSISLFLPENRSNPKPGSYYLKHVGFLGAAAPAVTGLKPVGFSGASSGTLNLCQDIADSPSFAMMDELAQLRRQTREYELERLIEAGRVLPCFKDEVLTFAASLDDRQTVSFSGGTDQTQKQWFMSYLARQPQVVSFGAMDLGTDMPHELPMRQMANIPDGYTADNSHDRVYRAARQIEREKGVSFAQAVELVLDGRA